MVDPCDFAHGGVDKRSSSFRTHFSRNMPYGTFIATLGRIFSAFIGSVLRTDKSADFITPQTCLGGRNFGSLIPVGIDANRLLTDETSPSLGRIFAY